MQKDLDEYLVRYNTKRRHRSRNMNGQTPSQVLLESSNTVRKSGKKEVKKAA